MGGGSKADFVGDQPTKQNVRVLCGELASEWLNEAAPATEQRIRRAAGGEEG